VVKNIADQKQTKSKRSSVNYDEELETISGGPSNKYTTSKRAFKTMVKQEPTASTSSENEVEQQNEVEHHDVVSFLANPTLSNAVIDMVLLKEARISRDKKYVKTLMDIKKSLAKLESTNKGTVPRLFDSIVKIVS